jgi:hypothetical protein
MPSNLAAIISCLGLLISLILLYFSLHTFGQGIDMDVKCTLYEHSDDVNGNNVDVRVLVMGLKANGDYTAEVLPDHNSPATVTTESDFDGIFWVIAKIPNGEKSTLFKVNVYEGLDVGGRLIVSGDDDAPCFGIKSILAEPPSTVSPSQ